jgi:hypothetical protein
MILLRLDASFVMTPRASFRFHWNSNRVLRPKPENHRLVVLRPKPPNRREKRIRYASSTISKGVIVVLDRPIPKSSCTSS